MKVCIYTIAKNEELFIRRYMEYAKEADYVCILDTGSTDDTAKIAREMGAIVAVEAIEPFRFDVARNRSLDLVPEDADVCICVDIDEVLLTGWRESLENAWNDIATRGIHRLIWSRDEYGNPGVEYTAERVHARHGYHWEHAVHETLVCDMQINEVYLDGFILEHTADPNKSRSDYLGLLEIDAYERPEDDRAAHYLGREYMYRQDYAKAIFHLKRHLSLEASLWAEERCASMRFLARCYEALGDVQEAKNWLYRACAESWLREPLVEMANLMYRLGDMRGTAFFAGEALKIEEKNISYITEIEAWGSLPHDLLSVASWYIGDKETALIHARKAFELAPGDERLKSNLAICERGIDG